jgi:uncharacterized protein (DUF2345 family)
MRPRSLMLSVAVLAASTCTSTVRADGDGHARTAQAVEVDEQHKVARIEVRGSQHERFANLDYQTLKLRASGSADVELAGKVKTLEMVVSGSSRIDARELRAEIVEIEVAGSTDIYVTADREFRIEASGSAIHLQGDGKVTRNRVTGSVSINRQAPGASP